MAGASQLIQIELSPPGEATQAGVAARESSGR